jgi:hypothetical protein
MLDTVVGMEVPHDKLSEATLYPYSTIRVIVVVCIFGGMRGWFFEKERFKMVSRVTNKKQFMFH